MNPDLERRQILDRAMRLHQQGRSFEADQILGELLRDDSQCVDALHFRGLIALQTNRINEAIYFLRLAVDLAPDMASLHSNLGAAYKRAGQLDEALCSLNNAIQLSPQQADPYNNRGNVKAALGLYRDAIADYGEALKLRPHYTESLFNLGFALSQIGDLIAARSAFEKTLALKPDHHRCLLHLAKLHRRLGQPTESEELLIKALSLQPRDPDALVEYIGLLITLERLDRALSVANNLIDTMPSSARFYRARADIFIALNQLESALVDYDLAVTQDPHDFLSYLQRGTTKATLGYLPQAIEDYDQAIRLSPNNARAHFNRGLALRQIERYEDAIQSYETALALNPKNPDVLAQLGNCFSKLGRFDQALKFFNDALSENPTSAEIHYNRALALQEYGRTRDAIEGYREAVRLDPKHKAAWNNLGACLQTTLDPISAIEAFEQAVLLDPTYAEAQWNLAVINLMAGRFKEGWEKFDWRFRTGVKKLALSTPLWTGQEALAGKTLLIHAEQGFGDSIQFCRYASLAAEKCLAVVLVIPPRLKRLMKSLTGVKRVIGEDEDFPPHDFHCPMMSLPRAFNTRIDSIPTLPAYLHAPVEVVKHWSDLLGKKHRPRIGICWRGNPKNKMDYRRSMSLSDFSPLFTGHWDLISLQVDVTDEEKLVMSRYGIRHFGDQQKDFADAAALCSLMDVVVSVDTAIAHLSGAVGQRTYILLAHEPDFRWLLGRSDSPWYPSAKLFRQTHPQEWRTPIEEVKLDLGFDVAHQTHLPDDR